MPSHFSQNGGPAPDANLDQQTSSGDIYRGAKVSPGTTARSVLQHKRFSSISCHACFDQISTPKLLRR